MDDLIRRQAALNAMDTWDKFGCDPDGKLVRYDDDKHYVPYVHYDDMVHVIKCLPSAQPEYTEQDVRDSFNSGYACGMEAAQSTIIHCKDCVHYGRADKRRFYRGYDCLDGRIASIVPDRDFCSRAVRRKESDG